MLTARLTAAGGWGASGASRGGPPGPPLPGRSCWAGLRLSAPRWGHNTTGYCPPPSVPLAGLFPGPLVREWLGPLLIYASFWFFRGMTSLPSSLGHPSQKHPKCRQLTAAVFLGFSRTWSLPASVLPTSRVCLWVQLLLVGEKQKVLLHLLGDGILLVTF